MAEAVGAILAAATAPPTETALAVMRLSLVDWIAVGRAGVAEPVARITRALAEEEGGAPRAAIFGGGRWPERMAALVNGTTSHALDYDDTHFAHIGHPSVAVLPAALAIAERTGAGHADFVAAALAGTEASVRFGLLFGRGHYEAGFHQTATAGAFGATVATCLLLTADRRVLSHALGLASTRAAGLKSQFGTMGKPFNAGIAAATGVEAALLAARGFVSDPDGIDGPRGFAATHHADGGPDHRVGFLMEEVSHKFHACCHGLHAMLEALAALKPVPADDVQSVAIATHPRWLAVCDKPAPRTGLEAKFSYRATAALSLLGHDTAALDTYRDALCSDPRVIALRDRVTVTADGRLPETAARVTLVTPSGPREAAFDLDAPMALADRAARVRAKAAALVGPAEADRLWGAVHGHHATLTDVVACLG